MRTARIVIGSVVSIATLTTALPMHAAATPAPRVLDHRHIGALQQLGTPAQQQ